MNTNADSSPAAHAASGHDRRWLGLFAVLAAMIMNLLDSTVANVAGPAIRADLGGTTADLQWVATAYTLAMAVGLLTGGRLGDMFGRRRMLLWGVTGFLVTSAACALAWSPGSLIVARAAQGLCAALMLPQSFGLIKALFPPQQVGKAFGALGPVIGLATILGPLVAGTLVDADVWGTGWRMVFLINLPLGAFALAAGVRSLPRGGRQDGLRLDGVGALLGGAGMFLLVFPLVQGRELGWPAWLWTMTAGAVAAFVLFGVRQTRRLRAGRAPLVELGVLRLRSYSSGLGFTVVFFGAIVGFSLTLGLFLQLGRGYGPMDASIVMAPWAIGAFFGSAFGGALMGRLGRHILHIGLAVMAVGQVLAHLVIGSAGTGVDGSDLVVPLLIYGFGMGQIFVPLFDIVLGDVRNHELGSASGLLESFQQTGSSLGVAVLGTVFFSGVTGSTDGPASVGDFVSAERQVVLLALGMTVLAFALAFLLPRRARQATPAADDSPTAPTAEAPAPTGEPTGTPEAVGAEAR
ncbi:MFS transporter [Streptomyces sp. RFCAC02]|uniref:MFS transporter n=1 Tax=Streptomyces sp. RFCAC02 TaxID=2499143 RepID=UPI00101EA53A|nr:MFS transporter [Streptomyces sp. RFCAC02]